MHPFRYLRAVDQDAALRAGEAPGARYLAGGTTLVDLMRLDVMRPSTLVDVTHLPLGAIEPHGDGLRVGALVKNTELAYHPIVLRRYTLLSEAVLAGASPQIRNMASVAGNLLQRTRCAYFRDTSVGSCNKRTPGSGCAAIDGYARMHAILGTSEHCIAAHPSDMCVALVALDAVIGTRFPDGRERAIPIADLYTVPGDHPERENVLSEGELITHVDLPPVRPTLRSRYVKVCDRASYAFALASAAVALELEGGAVRAARVALGGVATKPWRSPEAEALLTGKPATREGFRRAAEAALAGAHPRRDNAFKVELAKRTLVRALSEAASVS